MLIRMAEYRRSPPQRAIYQLRQIIAHVALDTMPRWTTLLAKRCLFRVTTAAKVVELAFE
jgi:hypothetical protein